ncbi:hypothetical protein FQZ97_1032150 [compost metagenome]
MGLGGPGADLEVLEQTLAHDVRRAAHGFGHAQVHVGLAEVDRHQLRMAVGEVQEADIAELGQVVHRLARARLAGQHILVIQSHAARAGHGEHLHEFTTTEAHKHSLTIDC